MAVVAIDSSRVKTSRTVTALPFDKKELGEWAPKLRQGFLEVPAKLDDGMKTGLRGKSKEYTKIYRALVLRTILLGGLRYPFGGSVSTSRGPMPCRSGTMTSSAG